MIAGLTDDRKNRAAEHKMDSAQGLGRDIQQECPDSYEESSHRDGRRSSTAPHRLGSNRIHLAAD
jgi:hypothetical protein